VVLEHDQEQEESKLEETASHTCHPKPAAQVTFGPIITQNLVTKCDQLGGGFQDLKSLGQIFQDFVDLVPKNHHQKQNHNRHVILSCIELISVFFEIEMGSERENTNRSLPKKKLLFGTGAGIPLSLSLKFISVTRFHDFMITSIL
jgi:hypothetical protein